MRVTQSMISRNALLRVNQNREKMNDIQERIASGKKVNRPSDDPTRYARASRYENTIAQNEQYLRKIEFAQSWIDNSVSLLEQLDDIALEAKNVVNNGADGQSDADIRLTLADKMEALLNEALSIVNAQYLGKNVFAGTDTKIATPFALNSGIVSYSGNDMLLTRSYSETVQIAINVSGQDIMDTDIFGAMTNAITALRANDESGIRAEIDTLKNASDQLVSLTAEMGSRSKNMELIKSRLEQSTLDLNDFLSETRDANLDEEIVKYSAEELAYQASLKVTASSIQLNIMDYLYI